MKPWVEKCDPEGQLFEFDGVKNVQNTGKINELFCPRATLCHGTEYVIALYFVDLSKLNSVNVYLCMCLFMFLSLCNVNLFFVSASFYFVVGCTMCFC